MVHSSQMDITSCTLNTPSSSFPMLEPYLSLSPKLNDVPKESFICLWEESSKMESQKRVYYTKQKRRKKKDSKYSSM